MWEARDRWPPQTLDQAGNILGVIHLGPSKEALPSDAKCHGFISYDYFHLAFTKNTPCAH